MPKPLHRFNDRERMEAEQVAALQKILAETEGAEPPTMTQGTTSGGDESRLRGLPAIGRGVSGATVSTDPVRALLAKERRGRRGR